MYSRFTRLIDRIQFFGLLLAVVLIPLVFNVKNQNIVILKPILAQLIAFGLMALWFIDSIERGQFKLPESALNIPIVAYFLWLVITIVTRSQFVYFSLEETGRHLAAFIFFFLVLKCIRDFTRLKWLLWVLFAVCLLSTGYGYMQYYGLGMIDWGREVLVSTFGNKNFFTGFLVLTTPVLFGYALSTSKLPIRIILVGLGLAQLNAIILTETRTGFLALLVSAVVFFVLGLRFLVWPRISRKRLFLLASVLGILLGILGLYFMATQNLRTRLGNAVDLQQGTGRVRWIMWTGSSRAAIDYPVTGHGHGVFQLVFPNYRPTFYHRFRVSHNTRHSHNEFLEILMENGVVGLSLFLLLMIVYGVISYRFLVRNRNWFYQSLVIGLVAGVSGSLAQNFASVNLRWMSSTFIFWLLFALVPAVVRINSDQSYHIEKSFQQTLKGSYRLFPPFSYKTVFHLLILGVFLGSGYWFYRMIRSDFKLKSMNAMIRYAESKRMPWSRAINAGEASLNYNPYNLSARYKFGYIFLKTENYARAREAYDNLTDIAPNYAQIHNNVALIHRRFGNNNRSLLHFEWATWLEDNTRNHMNLMRRYLKAGMKDRALWHGFHIPRIQIEENRNSVHRNVVALNDRDYEEATVRINKRKNQNQKFLRGLEFLARNFRQSKPSFSRMLRLTMFLKDPASRRTISYILRSKESGEMVSPHLLLAVTSQLRGMQSKRTNQLRKQFLNMLSSWRKNHPDSDPLYELAIADLYAQLGRNKIARRLVGDRAQRWEKTPFYAQIIRQFNK
ncbi:MAG: O-antigen ligase family protein [bacterium]